MDTIKQKRVRMPEVYCHPVVRKVVALHAELLSVYPGELRVLEVLDTQAKTLLAQFKEKDDAACVQLGNWLPAYAGMKSAELLKQDLTIHHMRLAVAHEHGFESWETAVVRGDEALDVEFENAVDAALSGNVSRLAELIESAPDLVTRRSQYGHAAQIHFYLAANGLETWRQVVPANADEVLELLIEAGADVASCIHVYGGKHTMLELLLSSAHPRKAGVLDHMIEVLEANRQQSESQ